MRAADNEIIMKVKISSKKSAARSKNGTTLKKTENPYETRFLFLGHKVFDEIKTLARLATPAQTSEEKG